MASLTQWTEFEQAPEDGEGQESLACCSSWGRKGSDTTERLDSREQQGGAPFWVAGAGPLGPHHLQGLRSGPRALLPSSPVPGAALAWGPCQPDFLPPPSLSSMKYNTFKPGLFLFYSHSVQLAY